MYVRSDESSDDRNSSNRDNRNNSSRDNSNRDNNSRGRSQRPAGNGRPGDNARQGDNTRQGNAPRNNDSRRPDSGRNERDRPSRPARSEGSSPYDSPWKRYLVPLRKSQSLIMVVSAVKPYRSCPVAPSAR